MAISQMSRGARVTDFFMGLMGVREVALGGFATAMSARATATSPRLAYNAVYFTK